MTILVVIGFCSALKAQTILWDEIFNNALVGDAPGYNVYYENTTYNPFDVFGNISELEPDGKTQYFQPHLRDCAYLVYTIQEAGTYKFQFRFKQNDGSNTTLNMFWANDNADMSDDSSKNIVKEGIIIPTGTVQNVETDEFELTPGTYYFGFYVTDVGSNCWNYFFADFRLFQEKSVIQEEYNISWNIPQGGTINVLDSDGNPLTNGGKILSYTTITINATPAENYILESLEVNGATQVGETNQYEVTGDVTINATFTYNKWSQVVYKEFIGSTATAGLIETHSQGSFMAYGYNFWDIKVANLYGTLKANKDEYLAVEHTIEEGETGIYKFSYEMYTGKGNTYTFFCRNMSTNENIFEESKTLTANADEKHIETGEFTIDEPGTYRFGWYLAEPLYDDIYIRSFELLKKDEAPVTPTNCIIEWEQPSAGGTITVMKGSETLVSQSTVEY